MATKKENIAKIDIEEMAKAGVHFGHRSSNMNPKMKPYIAGIRNTINVFDLEKTIEKMQEALQFLNKLVAEGKTVLFVGTKVQVKYIVREVAEQCAFPYVNERWLGGTFTNFTGITKRLDYFKDLERKRAAGELEKYTKKERLEIDKELKRLEIKFGGIKNMTKLPDAIFICDMKKDEIAVREANQTGVKIIGIADANVDPGLADFPIPGNDDAASSVRYILEKVKEIILKAKSEIPSVKQEVPSEKK
ncbi:MAG: 30S ribosomal protein S2 [Candidatus Parcubacteria bacterium]|nr:30S ribosomal protein S2 [Candidatus Parcubacteria bacterium]